MFKKVIFVFVMFLFPVVSFSQDSGTIDYSKLTPKQWHDLILKQARKGIAGAENEAGNMYHFGNFGVPKDGEKAFYWYQKSAKQNFPDAVFNLGNAYFNGEGVEQDFDQAEFLYKKATGLKVAEAAVMLGNMYTNGAGVSSDQRKAVYWYQQATDLGSGVGANNLAVAYWDGSGGLPQNLNKAYQLFKLAKERGYNSDRAINALCSENRWACN